MKLIKNRPGTRIMEMLYIGVRLKYANSRTHIQVQEFSQIKWTLDELNVDHTR